MRTEDQLHSKVISTLYILGAVIMLILSVQNYRYGLYPLVYTASILMVVLSGLAIYARLAWDEHHLNRASLWALGFCMALVLKNSIASPDEVMHWIFPLTLLCFVALRHRQAMVIAGFSAVLLFLSLWWGSSLLNALAFAAGFGLLVALASTYARLQQQRNRTLVELEIRDPMTRAYNFRHLEDTLSKELCRADRTGKALSLIGLEIDYFPQVIDVNGMLASNDLLSQLSESLRSMIRAGDSQYFDGKQTFYLLLPCTPSEGVVVIAERIRRAIEESSWPVVDSITVSLGCTSYVSGAREANAHSFVNDANIALIEAQKNGHNRVCHH